MFMPGASARMASEATRLRRDARAVPTAPMDAT